MGDNDEGKKPEETADGEVVCEFFGIKIVTKNPNLARVLTTDVAEIMRLDVREVKDYIKGDYDEDGYYQEFSDEDIIDEEPIDEDHDSEKSHPDIELDDDLK